MSRTAVVFGPTGLVGKELVNELLVDDSYNEVITVSRKTLTLSDPKLKQIVLPDFSRLMQYRDKLDAIAYFCCIGTTIKTAGSKEEFRKVDLDIPKQIAQLAEILSINYLVVISSLGANIYSTNFYLRTKGEMEKSVRHAYSGNLKFVRPSLLMGKREESRLGEILAVIFMKVLGWTFIGPLRKYKGITANNVAKAMIRLSMHPADKMVYESDALQEMVRNM